MVEISGDLMGSVMGAFGMGSGRWEKLGIWKNPVWMWMWIPPEVLLGPG